jgi:hypothetical protein
VPGRGVCIVRLAEAIGFYGALERNKRFFTSIDRDYDEPNNIKETTP